ncbi:conserved protein of unknown function (plasmid) [Paraburkholderia kururiensis]
MTTQVLFEFLFHQAALPLALLAAWYGIATYRSGRIRTKAGHFLSRDRAPVRFWSEVVGGLVIAMLFALTGVLYLIGRP